MTEPEPLPNWLDELISKYIRDGVSLQLNWGHRDDHKVTKIIWTPGDPNALAEMIIKYCTGSLPITLDGHDYVITPAGVDEGQVQLPVQGMQPRTL
jgi:hypothetical protein